MGIIFKNKQNFACMFDGVVWIKTNDGQTTLTIVQNEKKNPKSNDFKSFDQTWKNFRFLQDEKNVQSFF